MSPLLQPVVELQAARAEQRGFSVVATHPTEVDILSPSGRRVSLSARLLWRALERLGPEAPPETVEAMVDAQRDTALSMQSFGDWEAARGSVLFSPEQPPERHADALLLELGEQVCAAILWTDGQELHHRWCGAEAMAHWKIDEDTLLQAAATNTAALLEETPLQVNQLQGVPAGVLLTGSYFKPALIMAPTLRTKVEAALGWPLLAVMPQREFLLLVPESARDLLPRLGNVVTSQFNGARDPLTLEVLSLSNDGVQVVGRFGA